MMTPKIKEELCSQILTANRQLFLSGRIAEACREKGTQKQLGFILELMEGELTLRDENRRKRLIKRAGFPVYKTFEGYSYANVKFPPAFSREGLETLDFVPGQKNLVLYGPVGIGKTHMAIAAGVKACNLGYKTEALVALAHYNENPYDLDANKITFAEVFEKWSTEHFPKISKPNVHGYNASYKLCSPLYDLRFTDLRKSHLQGIVDDCGKNYPTLKKLKVLFSVLYKFALENDIVSKDYSQYVDINQYRDRNPNKYDRQPFTKKEIDTVWKWKDSNEYVSIILMLIYTGCRISELLNLKKENVNLSERWFDVVASKTDAGIRKVPIAKKVLPLFEYWYHKNNCEYLLSTSDGEHFLYRNYYDSYWTSLINQIGMNHKPHDTRHTCVTLLTAAGVDDKIIKKIVGHKGQGVTEIVYTHFEIQQLIEAIDKI